ncbi:hypothetical protein Baya_8710 [Bagarius yarrelli]|uniref:Uncharacterized protein n=1 Tax=Bagarius yarrelli TaxID=175774 RepID=A0A556U7W0_BAGYA|nr:hypothetical protein Baya_8710 [Bagarius yarrelli]
MSSHRKMGTDSTSHDTLVRETAAAAAAQRANLNITFYGFCTKGRCTEGSDDLNPKHTTEPGQKAIWSVNSSFYTAQKPSQDEM